MPITSGFVSRTQVQKREDPAYAEPEVVEKWDASQLRDKVGRWARTAGARLAGTTTREEDDAALAAMTPEQRRESYKRKPKSQTSDDFSKTVRWMQ